ncbi:MAG: ATPase [Paenibacillus sp.]|jgi:N-acetylglucosamine kinase-like BadF-type ATPase|nr:ATPase [Paenibacillus sp.]
MKYYLGVDAGGSKTYTLVTDEHGHIIGKGHSGNGNHQLGVEQALRNITNSVAIALQRRGLHTTTLNMLFSALLVQIDRLIIRSFVR